VKFFILIFTCTLPLETMAATPPHAESSPNPHTILAKVGKVVSPNGIDEAKAVDIGGIRQWEPFSTSSGSCVGDRRV
jgi:hypothetical protein